MSKKTSKLQVVGIGASAGGLKALQELFDHIPNNTGMVFVIVQHLSPDFKSLMPELLSKHTEMPIFTAKDKDIIKPNCIYLNQRSKNLHIKESKIYQLDKGPKHNLNLPIDIFFHTLGEEFKENATAIILSGTGSDGSRGILSIKENGGTVMVQDPITAQFDGMPNSAINTNTVNYILDIEHIAKKLTTKTYNSTNLLKNSEFTNDSTPQIKEILLEVFKYSGIDFREYKISTLSRRIEKRMGINKISDISDYMAFLQKDNYEKNALKDDFLIGVTRFFRDEQAFVDLKEDIIPSICNSKKSGETIRVWTPGCSTGEEVYSIAILFNEYIIKNKLDIDFKIFATDIDPRGLNVASTGQYSMNIVNEIEKKYFDKYFYKIDETLQIAKNIRERIIFSKHNLINDPPFINMDLISCRNLLIYLDNNIQKKVMQNFQFSLNIFGYLFLGSSESLGSVAKHFKTIHIKSKIFQNISESKYSPNHALPFTKLEPITELNTFKSKIKLEEKTISKAYNFDKYLSRRYSPDTVFIDSNFNILFITGDVGKKLHHGEGVFENNLLKVVNNDMATLLKNGVKKTDKVNQDVVINNVINKTEQGDYTFNIKIHKPTRVKNLEGYYLIEFSEDKEIDATNNYIELPNIVPNESSNEQIEDLENELRIIKSDLQNAIEELETTNEELQSSNEELMAANEELQSTNEELQSVNEELYTVNSEMQEKNKELTNLTNDLQNLLDNTEIATLFLDNDLCIRKFTPAIKTIFDLEDDDLGRKLSTFSSSFDPMITQSLITDAQYALNKIRPVEKQLTDKNGTYYFLRVSPSITSNKTIDGVVITINNINKIKEIEKELEEVDLKYHNLFRNLSEGFMHCKIITNSNNEPIDWEYLDVNPAYEKINNKKAENIIGKRASEILPGLLEDPLGWLHKFGETALHGKNQTAEGYVKSLEKYFHINLFSPKKGEFAGTISDFTELKNKEKALTTSKHELNSIQRITQVGSWKFDLESKKVSWTEELYRIYKLDPTMPAPSYESHSKLYKPKSWDLLTKAVAQTQKDGTPYELELEIIKANGEYGWLLAKGEAVNENGIVVGLRGSAQDITTIKENEKALIHAKQEAEEAALANKHKNFFLANMSHEIRTPMSSVIGFANLLKNEELDKKTQLRFLEIIDNNSKQLLNLVDDIIDVSKIEMDELKMIYNNCHVSQLIENLALSFEQVKIQKEKQHLNIKAIIPSDLKNLNIYTDPRRLEQVLSNLLNNAVKFSEKGTITFGYTQVENYIKFYVDDQGIGIAKSKQSEIFERFKQVNYENNAKYGGTGLGLSICKAIVTLLGGDITVISKPGSGSRFEFKIPINSTSIKPDPTGNKIITTNTSFLKNKHILIAEDNKLIRMLIEILLKKTGAKLKFATNGKIAVDYFKENPNIDLVLLDIRMPEMNGIEAMEYILKINPKTKIIMQTAHAMEEEKNICYEKGCVDFLSKPIIKEQLFETLNKWLN